ncbi:hypothetical protein BaRGS_00000005, partial [Batillaria attramentaria]
MSDDSTPDSKSPPPAPPAPKPSFSISSILGPREERPDSGSEGEGVEEGGSDVSTRSRDAVVFSLADIYSKFHVYATAADSRLSARAFNQWYPWYPAMLHPALDYP